MKQVFFLGLAVFGAVSLTTPATTQASAASVVQLAQAPGAQHGGHAAHSHGHDHGGHAKGAPAPSQEAIAAMAISNSAVVTDCWIRLLPLPAPSAGYFVASNQGSDAVTLTGAASARYGDVMLHQTTHSDGMSRMSSVEGVEIAPGEKLEFKPGGYHIMLEKPEGDINVGDVVPMQFLLASNEKAEAQCEVKPANTVAK